MKEKPILFNGEMVRAIMDGRKTQTRRIIKPQPDLKLVGCDSYPSYKVNDAWQSGFIDVSCPFGRIGDELWVRETMYSDGDGWWFPASGEFYFEDSCTKEKEKKISDWCNHQEKMNRITVPSIHMPRWASRIQLRITDIRVERVQDINDDGVEAEGIDSSESDYGNLCQNIIDSGYHHDVDRNSADIACFKKLWDSINRKREYSWESNPYVWVIEFERIK